jgi:predicted DNA-binding transcriptional regulator AlpA
VSEIRWLSEQQAADFLEVRVSTLQRWRTEKKGPRWTRIGRRPVYLIEEIETWLRG